MVTNKIKNSRRKFLRISSTALIVSSIAPLYPNFGTTSKRKELNSEFLCDLKLKVKKIRDFGDTPRGHRALWQILGGTFTGPKLNGTVLSDGGDWILILSDGTKELDVRLTLQTDDGHIIYTYYRAIAHSEYFVSTPIFETGSKKYSWLNRIISVGIGEYESGIVSYSIYTIL